MRRPVAPTNHAGANGATWNSHISDGVAHDVPDQSNLAMARISQIGRETADKLANRYNLTRCAGSPSASRPDTFQIGTQPDASARAALEAAHSKRD